jgi:hypothetical protein
MSFTNKEGLTWKEWHAAALCYVPEHQRIAQDEYRWDDMRRAWLRGEDPTDWAPFGVGRVRP